MPQTPTGPCYAAQLSLQHSEPPLAFQVLGCASTPDSSICPLEKYHLITGNSPSPHARRLTAISCSWYDCSTAASPHPFPSPHHYNSDHSEPGVCSAMQSVHNDVLQHESPGLPRRTVVTQEEAVFYSQETSGIHEVLAQTVKELLVYCLTAASDLQSN